MVSEVKKINEIRPIPNVPLEDSKNFIERINYLKQENQPNPINNYFQSNMKYLIDNGIESHSNFSRNSEEEYLERNNELFQISNNSSNNMLNPIPNDSQTFIQATLFDVIGYNENKRIALYKDINGPYIYVYEFTIGNYFDSKVDWFFQNRFETYSYIYNYLKEKYALNLIW